MAQIELKNIEKAYGNNIILSGFNLNIEAGEYVGITGPSGCGKSTLLNMIGLLELPNRGTVSINGVSGIKPGSGKAIKILRSTISYLFQNYALIDNDTVEQNLNLALHYVKADKKQREQYIQKALSEVKLSHKDNQKVLTLSGGEQQRAAIARLLLKPCKIVLADEPTGSLDSANRDIVMGYLRKLNEQGKTVVVVSHDPQVIEQAHRVIRLGEVIGESA